MTDYDLPDLPSDEELGITDEDREAFEEEFGDESPEMSDAELAALLGESPTPKREAAPSAPSKASASGAPSHSAAGASQEESKPSRAERKAAKAEAKRKAREEKARAKAAKKAAAAAALTSEAEGDEASGEDAVPAAATDDDGPRSRWRGPVTLALLIATAWVASLRTGLPAPAPANAPDTAFSSARAMSTLVEIAREPHAPGSPEHARVRAYLIERLTDLGLEPEVQTTTSVIQGTAAARAATVRNVIARIPGTDPTGAVLITAHYDSREIAVGAGDDGSGVVSILESLRALGADTPLRNDVIVLLTDAEELGLLGARAFVDQHPLMSDVTLALSFEMRGGGGPSIMFETNEDNGWVVRALEDFDSHPWANSMFYEVYKAMPNDTDFTPFREAGVQGLNFAGADKAHVYHQEYDTPENLSEATLQHHGIHALGALKYFGREDLSEVNAPNVVYFSVPGLGLVVYDARWVLPISGVLVLLLVGLLVAGRKQGVRPARAVAGVVVFALAAGAAYGIGYGALQWLPRFHEETGALHGSLFHSEGWYVLALAFAVLAIVSGLASISRRWLTVPELATGAIVLPASGAVALSIMVPLGAMNLQWPVLAGLAAIIVYTLLADRAEGNVGWIASMLLAAPVVLLLVPMVEMVWLGLRFEMLPAAGVLITVAFFLCLPALAGLRHPNSWWGPGTAALVTAVSLGVGLLWSRASEQRPDPSTLVYAYEHGSGAAVWATAPSAGDDDEAHAWAVDRAGSSFENERDLGAFGYLSFDVPVTPAPIVDAARPSVGTVTDTVMSGVRHLTLGVRSNIGAEMLGFRLTGDTRLRSINGVELEESDEIERADHWGEPERDVVLELTLSPTDPVGLDIIEHLLRPEELLGAEAFSRPPDMAANVNRMSDRAMFRYSLGVLGETGRALIEQPPDTGVPVESVTIEEEPLPTDPVPTDSLATPPDTIGSAPPSDTIGSTVPPDTVAVDTTAVEPVASDTLPSVDTLSAPPDTLTPARRH